MGIIGTRSCTYKRAQFAPVLIDHPLCSRGLGPASYLHTHAYKTGSLDCPNPKYDQQTCKAEHSVAQTSSWLSSFVELLP